MARTREPLPEGWTPSPEERAIADRVARYDEAQWDRLDRMIALQNGEIIMTPRGVSVRGPGQEHSTTMAELAEARGWELVGDSYVQRF